MEFRKLQMTGGASYTVSLPKEWVKEQGLKVGDVVAIIRGSDSSLTISAKDRIHSNQGSSEVALT
ncbi:MAG TPA: AbrB/MazE/SpoVT family DNA-binding domain-containing protein, partial [Candidatus Bathyarchaeia archaeon]